VSAAAVKDSHESLLAPPQKLSGPLKEPPVETV